jgi:pimeloyl-ACP methyl ester carboxylesterase
LTGLLLFSARTVLAQQNAAGKNGAAVAPAAQAQKGQPSKSEPQDLIQTAADGWPIHMTYFESSAGKESPVVILLTSTEGNDNKDSRNRRIWQPTAAFRQKAGFAVAAVDLRKHGDSVPPTSATDPTALKMSPNDYPAMVAADLEAVKDFLMVQHKAQKLNIRKLGIVSMGSSSMVAAAFAVADWAKEPYPDAPTLATRTPRGQDVRALIMYSPNSSVRNLNANTIMKAIRGLQISVYVVASKDIRDDARNAEKIFKAVELKEEQYKEFRKTTMVAGNVHAEGFLEGRYTDATNKDILDFLMKSLSEMDAPWVSRNDRRFE